MSTLFRPEAVEAKRKRLYGSLVLRTPPALAISIAALTIVCLAAAGAAASADYTQWQTVDGYVAPSNGITGISATRAGTVTTVFVRDGEFVAKGSPLLEISAAAGTSIDGRSRETIYSLLSEQAQATEHQALLADEQGAAQAGQSALKVESLRHQAANLTEQLALQRAKVRTQEEMQARLGGMVAQGFVSKREYQARENDLLSDRQTLAEIQARHDDAQAAAKVQALDARTHTLAQRIERQNLRKQHLRLAEQAASMRGEETYVISAATDGVVTGLAVQPGSSVKDNSMLGYVLPRNPQFEAVLLVPTRSSGFLALGKDVRIEYEAFPYQQFGRHSGKISRISAVISSAGEQLGPLKSDQPTYRVTVKLDSQRIMKTNRVFPLQSGMMLKARIAGRQQRLWNWIIEPGAH